MLIKTNTVITNLAGESMKDMDADGNASDATLKSTIVNALLSPVQKETGTDKVQKYELAKKVYEADEIELTAEEITLIKARVGDAFVPIVVGRVFEMLEGKS
jgi:hypothetical protein